MNRKFSVHGRICKLQTKSSTAYFLARVGLAGAGSGWVRFRYHCWTIPTRLLVKIYNAKPLENGKTTNITEKVSGIIFIIWACCGSVVVIGVILETRYIVTPTSTGRM